MKFKHLAPSQIEVKSFEIISETLGERKFTPENESVIKRCIHTSADFDYADNLYFTKDVVLKIKTALAQGADILSDTTMVKAGINKRKLAQLGGEVHCYIADPKIAQIAVEREVTRSYVSMEKLKDFPKPVIVAVGNAPTALMALHDLIKQKAINPVAIIAVPVGFVNVVESKQMIIELGWPAIVAKGRKGGSNIAAAIVNACLYQIN